MRRNAKKTLRELATPKHFGLSNKAAALLIKSSTRGSETFRGNKATSFANGKSPTSPQPHDATNTTLPTSAKTMMRFESSPKLEKVDYITNEIIDALRLKLVKIEEQQRAQEDRKKALSVVLGREKDDVARLKNHIEEHKSTLNTMHCSNQKVQEDCDAIQEEINSTGTNIENIEKEFERNAAVIHSEICSLNAKREKDIAALYSDRDKAKTCERVFAEQKSRKNQSIEYATKEIEDLKEKLQNINAKEENRLEVFMNQSHSIDASINFIKARWNNSANNGKSTTINGD